MTIDRAKGFVIDQNAMSPSSRLIQDMMTSDPDAILILPDVAFEEMIRPEDWLLTFRLSLAQIARYADQVYLAGSIPDALSWEILAKKAATSAQLLDDKFREFLVPLLHEIAAGADGPAMQRLKSSTPDIRAEMLASHLAPGAGKTRMEELVRTWKQGEHTKTLLVKLLRTPRGAEHDALRLAIAKQSGDEIFIHFVTSQLSMTADSAREFLAARPMLLRYTYGGILDSLNWAKDGGNVAAASERVINSREFDMHHAVIATYFEGLLSHDKGAHKIYENLDCLLLMKDL